MFEIHSKASRLLPGLLGLLLVGALRAGEPAAFQLDRSHSTIGFSVRHLGVSRVRGKFGEFSGEIVADPDTGFLTQVSATVAVASVDTGMSGRDDHLKGEDFFAATEFPEMKLATRKITWSEGEFTAEVDLTIRDKTLPVEFRGELVGRTAGMIFGKKQVRVGYSATATIDRQAFGLRFNRLAEGVSVVGNDVKIELEVEASRPME